MANQNAVSYKYDVLIGRFWKRSTTHVLNRDMTARPAYWGIFDAVIHYGLRVIRFE